MSKTTPLHLRRIVMFRECETWKCNHPTSLSPPPSSSYPNIIWYDRFAYWSFGRFVGQVDYGFRSWLEIRHRDKGGCIIILADPRTIRSGKRIFRVSPLILRNCGVTSFATIITVSRLSNATIDDNWRNWRWDLVWFGRGFGIVDGRDRFIATSERSPPNLSKYSRLDVRGRYIEYLER